MHLAWQDGVLGHIGLARVLVQWQDEEPCYPYSNAEGGEVGREFEEDGRAAEG